MEKYSEITFELTNRCPFECKYCSTNCNTAITKFLDYGLIYNFLNNKRFDRIILSGGEPLLHPRIGEIILLCKKHTDDVVLYSNLITHLAYNHSVIDGVTVECMVTVPDDTSTVRILKRVKQGREKERPEVKFSGNFTEDCNCDRTVMTSYGELKSSACRKDANE